MSAPPAPPAAIPPPSKLAENVIHFTRLLRGAGLRLGPASGLDALAAASAVDVLRRDELYWALHAVLVQRPEDRAVFDQAFRLFWRDPLGAEDVRSFPFSPGGAWL